MYQGKIKLKVTGWQVETNKRPLHSKNEADWYVITKQQIDNVEYKYI